MDHEDKIKDIEIRFIALVSSDGLDEGMYWLAGAFKQEAINNAADTLLTGNNVYIQELIVAKAKEVHGD
jgi:hypothetical protein